MDNFEALVRLLLEKEGYWTRQSEKVPLTKEEKQATGKPSIPRPEIDLVAFDPKKNRIVAMEVKSFLDSPGVQAKDFNSLDKVTTEGKYKLFTCPSYRKIVFHRLLVEYSRVGLANDNTDIQLGLAAGKIYSTDTEKLKDIFNRQNWILWTPNSLAEKTRKLAALGYENDPFVLVSKLLVRNPERRMGDFTHAAIEP